MDVINKVTENPDADLGASLMVVVAVNGCQLALPYIYIFS
jgi:hypothetical protein